jgi:hypothetical protein
MRMMGSEGAQHDVVRVQCRLRFAQAAVPDHRGDQRMVFTDLPQPSIAP